MNNKPLLIFAIALGLLLCYAIYDFFTTHERKEVTEYTSFKGEARDNPLFAARLFLKEMGIPAKDKSDLQSIGNHYPNTNTIIILDTHRSTLSEEKIEQLLSWVEKGGHLITPVSVDHTINKFLTTDEDNDDKEVKCYEEDSECFYSDDSLQEALNITVTKSIFIEADKDDTKTNDDDFEIDPTTTYFDASLFSNSRSHRVFNIQLDNAPKPLTLTINPSFNSITSNEENENKYELLIHDDLFMLQREHGEGMISLISQSDIFENQLLRESDNAQIFWYLVHSHHQQPSEVWLFHNDDMPNLLSILWRYGWAVILSLAGLLAVWLFQSAQRFGPMIPKQAIARRRLMEHIEASGQYFWKVKNKQLLIDSTRHALNQRMSQLHPAWNNTDKVGKINHLAEMLKIPSNHVKYLLFNNKIQQDEDFTQLMIELESIRRKL